MSKQLLIYESAVPVSATRHRQHSLVPASDYGFAATINAVPLMAVEFLRAADEYPIVFAKVGEEVVPAAVLGVQGNRNLYVSPDGKWLAKYIPAFIRRYPFVFASSGDGKTLTLCIDEKHPGVNTEGRGERLFGDDGKPAAYTQRVLKFLQEYQVHFERTRIFCKRAEDLGLLKPMSAQVTMPKGGRLALSGFLSASREQLRAIEPDSLAKLARTDELELLYLQMHSLRNFTDVKDRLIGSLKEDAAPTDTAATAPASDVLQ